MKHTTFNSHDLKEQLWTTLKDTRSKKIQPQVANAVAVQAREIMRIVRMELQVAVLNGQKPGKNLLEFASK